MGDVSEADFLRLARVKSTKSPASIPLGPEMVRFFKSQVQKPHARLGKINQLWASLVPEALLNHTSLEGYKSGTLSVLVDTAPHLYDLKQLLLAGLQKQLLQQGRSTGLRKISLKRGQWYDRTEAGDPRPRF